MKKIFFTTLPLLLLLTIYMVKTGYDDDDTASYLPREEPIQFEKKEKSVNAKKITDKQFVQSARSPSSINTPKIQKETLKEKEDFKERFWEKRVSSSLLKFQPEGTKLLVKEVYKKGIVSGRTIASIVIKRPDNRESSFKAVINLRTGRIIETYDRRIDENISKMRSKRYEPTGILPQ